MKLDESKKAGWVLGMNTLAFMLCLGCWVMNGVLVTFLVKQGIYHWNEAQIGWLIGAPIFTGSVTRLPVGMLTDHCGGRPVFSVLMIFAAGAMWLLAYADSYLGFLLASFGFGLAGASFAVGVASIPLWFKRERQGSALGIFGFGNIGAGLTSIGAPILLKYLTAGGASPEAWRMLPKICALALAAMAILFYVLTPGRKLERGREKTFLQRLAPLKHVRVWRFGIYYFLVFGGFVGLSQWLIPYYVNVYALPLATAGFLAACFSLPSGAIRAAGGWISDRWGARSAMYGVLATILVCFSLLAGLRPPVAVFTFIVFLAGLAMGIGMAAIYKHIPDYFPDEVGVVGGLVGVFGGLGGFFLPTLFGYLLQETGLWSTPWILLLALTAGCLAWMHSVVRRIRREESLNRMTA
ncbi:MAG TPA: MFS transporter [bacterium]|nr:MFS transporter [bacterium]